MWFVIVTLIFFHLTCNALFVHCHWHYCLLYLISHSLQALKTKHDTPKYGLIYHAQLVGQASAKLKGKVRC